MSTNPANDTPSILNQPRVIPGAGPAAHSDSRHDWPYEKPRNDPAVAEIWTYTPRSSYRPGETIDFQRSMGETLEVIRERMRSPGGDIMATAGIDSLDRGTHGGLRANQLTILAARPSVGKSSLACQYATA